MLLQCRLLSPSAWAWARVIALRKFWSNSGLQVITEKLLDYLRSATDDSQKAEVAQRIGELAERFAPDTQWFIDTMNQVCNKLSCAPESPQGKHAVVPLCNRSYTVWRASMPPMKACSSIMHYIEYSAAAKKGRAVDLCIVLSCLMV